MSEEKKKVGRPKMYDSKAERQKAYYERKREKMKKLEEETRDLEIQKRVLQEKLSKSLDEVSIKEITRFEWEKFTPSEISTLEDKELRFHVKVLNDRIKNVFSYEDLVDNLVNIANVRNSISSEITSKDKQYSKLVQEFSENIARLQESMQLQTILYLLEAELASRERLVDRDGKLSTLKDEIKELEAKELKEKPKIKSKN